MDKTAGTLQLRDIHLPDAPGYWPLAPGWWIVLVILILISYLLIRWYRAYHKKNSTVRLIQDQLHSIRKEYESHKNKHQFAVDASMLLKRFVRHILKDSDAVSLTGKNWMSYLNSRSGKDLFSGFDKELNQAPYEATVEYDVSAYFATLKNFFPLAIASKKKFPQNYMEQLNV